MKSLSCICLVLVVTLLACSAPPSLPQQLPTHTVQAADFTAPTATSITTRAVKSLNMLVPRAAHTSTLLPNGMVLIAGGFTSGENPLASAEIFDPTTNEFSFTGLMNSPRQSHTATLLQNGKVFIAGGYGPSGEYLGTAELYDTLTGKFTLIGAMTTPRAGQTAVLLNNGNVLLAGGVTTGWVFLETAELFDPEKNIFSSTGNMHLARESHTATLLKDGKVLVAGGHQGRRSAVTLYSSAEIYDPVSSLFTFTTNMQAKRHKHDAILLEDGKVLVAGGSDERDENGQYKSAEVYNPETGQFSKVPDMKAKRYKFQGTSVLLNNGKVRMMGGADIVEMFDPATNTFAEVAENESAARLLAAATLLPDGRVVLSGGYGSNIKSEGLGFLTISTVVFWRF
jgi:hypothetical protein